MIAFVREHADRFGVEAICRTLGATAGGFITARGYRAAITRPRSARSICDEVLGEQIARLHQENYSVYGVRKMHAAMRRAGWVIGRDQTGRIMRSLGLAGARRGRKTFTTKTDAVLSRPADLVQRRFHPDAPRRLWVADITYVATWSGFAYVAFITDAYSRRIVGWNVAATLKADVLPLQALEMAAWNAGGVKTYIERKLRAGPPAGHEIVVLAPGERDAVRHFGRNARIVTIAAPPFPLDRAYRYFDDEAAVHAALDRLAPDMVEVSSPWSSATMVARWRGAAPRALIMHADPLAAYAYRWFGAIAQRETIDRGFDWFWRHLRGLDARYDLIVCASHDLSRRLSAGIH